MLILLIAMLWTIDIYKQDCVGINFIDLPGFGSDGSHESDNVVKGEDKSSEERGPNGPIFKGRQKIELPARRAYPPVRITKTTSRHVLTTSPVVIKPGFRRHWLVSETPQETTQAVVHDDKDENIKHKISMLVQQTMHDTEIKMKSVHRAKEKYRDKPSYRVGFILSMIKKSRDVLNELFNVAVKHRDEWKALEQLKIFELIVHTNVDTTNLVRQLVEIHIMNLNTKDEAHAHHDAEHHEPGPGVDPEHPHYDAEEEMRGNSSDHGADEHPAGSRRHKVVLL